MMDEDEAQEYACLLLEGHPEEEAARLAVGQRAANFQARIAPTRGSKPILLGNNVHWDVVDDRSGMDGSYWSQYKTVCADHRTDEEREYDWLKSDEHKLVIDNLLSRLGPRQRQVIRMRYGLGGFDPLVPTEIAEKLGLAVRTVNDTLWRAKLRLKALAEGPAPEPLTEAVIAKRLAQKQAQRKRRARLRAEGKKVT